MLFRFKRRTAKALLYDHSADRFFTARSIMNKRFSLPGGGVRSSESWEEGLWRELGEELHLPRLQEARRLGETTIDHDLLHVPFRNTITLYRIDFDEMPVIRTNWELYDPRWVSWEELLTLLPPLYVQIIREASGGRLQ